MKNNMVTEEAIERMVRDGFTEKMIYHYFSYVTEEREENFASGYMQWAHEHGFIAGHAIALGVNETNYKEYISDYDFYRCWPHNSWLKMWINDKLSLKYILQGTRWSNKMPEYYYYSMPQGGILKRLDDNPYEGQDFATFIKLLKEKKSFACKPNNGTESVGFHKVSYDSGIDMFRIDGEVKKEEELKAFVMGTPNYIYTEYIAPGCGLEKIHPRIHTLRIVVINEDGRHPEIVGGYIRFPVDKLGEANYICHSEKIDDFTYYAEVNFKTGEIGNPTAIYCNRIEKMPFHPDTGYDLSVGFKIPYWDKLIDMVKEISCYLFGTEFIGYDIGVTGNGFKIMEINGLPGNMGNQWSRNVTINDRYVEYIRDKIREIDDLPEEKRVMRRGIS